MLAEDAADSYSLGDGPDGDSYDDGHPNEPLAYHLTMLGYDTNDEALSFGHGAPLRPGNEVQLGCTQVKWYNGIEFGAHYTDIGDGCGGYEDHEFFGYRRSI